MTVSALLWIKSICFGLSVLAYILAAICFLGVVAICAKNGPLNVEEKKKSRRYLLSCAVYILIAVLLPGGDVFDAWIATV